VIEAKREEEGHRLPIHEQQAEDYAKTKLKWFADSRPLPFVYESTGIVTRYTALRDPKPRARPIFSFHHPDTLTDKKMKGFAGIIDNYSFAFLSQQPGIDEVNL